MNILHSLIVGEGDKNLLILHGFLGMGDNWKTLAKRWASQGWCVHLIDQRNHGRSFWSNQFDYSHMVNDILAYCHANKLKTISLLGHSMGGKVAMQMACNHPTMIDNLVIADIAPKTYPAHHQTILSGLAALNFTAIGSRQEAEEVLSKYVKEAAVRQFLLKNIYRVTPTQLALRLNIEVLKNSSDKIGDSLSPRARFNGKTLFLKGKDSGYILPTDIPLIKYHFPKGELVEIDNAGHWLHAENPAAFTHAIEQWWKS